MRRVRPRSRHIGTSNNGALSSRLISTHRRNRHTCPHSVVGVSRCGPASTDWDESMILAEVSCGESGVSTARIIEPATAKPAAHIQLADMVWELRVADHDAKHTVLALQNTLQVAALRRMMTPEMAEIYVESRTPMPTRESDHSLRR